MRNIRNLFIPVGIAAVLLVAFAGTGVTGTTDTSTDSSTTATAPLVTCRATPEVGLQGDDITVRGGKWAADSNVTVRFDDTLLDSTDVRPTGRFRLDTTVPEEAVRGTHSINVTGSDRDGLGAHCSTTVLLDEHPTAEDDDTTTSTSEPDDDGTSSTTSSTAPTTTPSAP